MLILIINYHFFFFNDTATTEIYTLSLHDALPICQIVADAGQLALRKTFGGVIELIRAQRQLREARNLSRLGGFDTNLQDRKSTRLNSSHLVISYAVFCLKKKNI